MARKKMIDADKICADQLFLRRLRPLRPPFRRYRCLPVMWPSH